MAVKHSLGPQRKTGKSGWEERPPVALGKHRKMFAHGKERSEQKALNPNTGDIDLASEVMGDAQGWELGPSVSSLCLGKTGYPVTLSHPAHLQFLVLPPQLH